VVLLDLRSGTYLGLDASAARIVDLLNHDPDPRRAAAELVSRFGIPLSSASADVEAVIAAVQDLSAPRIDRGRYPTLAGTRVVFKQWWRLPSAHRIATVRAVAIVLIAEVGLATLTLERLARLMGVPLSADRRGPPLASSEDLNRLSQPEQRAYWAVSWVLNRWLFDGTCLRQALAFGWFIRRRHPVLRLGMTDEDGTVAHAWVEAVGVAFNPSKVTDSFVTGATIRQSSSDLPDSDYRDDGPETPHVAVSDRPS
jgi:hypothetical protein